MKKFIISIFAFALIMILSILTMIYGWGIEPKNWWWIIGAGTIARCIVWVLEAIGGMKE